MSERNDVPAPRRGTNGTDTPAGRHLRLVEKAPPAQPDAGAEDTPPSRKSHLARLVDALHASRRIEAAQVSRRYLHLVQGERRCRLSRKPGAFSTWWNRERIFRTASEFVN
jgi:hypothetical protein